VHRLTPSIVFGHILVLLGTQASAQSPASNHLALADADAIAQWIALPAAPGHERVATDVIAASLPGWTRDAIGDLVLRRGSGTPRRVVACGLDEAAYVVSDITADGYVRLHPSGRARRSSLWDQFHEGQRVRILTRGGARPAVIAVRSTHLWRARGGPEPIVRVDDLWVDVGARSRTEVAGLGIAVLDPVIREWPPWRFGDVVAGPAAADRAGCAAVAAAARATPAAGETIWVLSAQHAFGYAGLRSVLSRVHPVDSVFIVDPALARDTAAAARDTGAVTRRSLSDLPALFAGSAVGPAIAIGIRAANPGTLAEVLRASDIGTLFGEVARASGVRGEDLTAAGDGSPAALKGVPEAPPPATTASTTPATGADSLGAIARLLATLSDAYGVSGREGPVRAAVTAALPAAWRHQSPQIDTAGDLIVAAGPDRDTIVIVAHMDEIGFRVSRIAHDGTTTLEPLGGFYASLWESQPALLHLDSAARAGGAAASACALRGPAGDQTGVPSGTLRGVFVPRSHATAKEVDTLTAWFGADSAGLAACGVSPGARVSGYKVASRLAALRFTARALDDRVGCTALLFALHDVDPARLTHKVIFVFSVREEVGLEGAAAVAAAVGASVRRVHAVDTFVSSDSPLESPRFALAPLGAGAALRMLDNSSVTPPEEVARALRIARLAGIPIQSGTTNGGNDGSVFVPHGAIDVPLGWPLRYSHSPAEVIDLRDVHALARLVAALAAADPRS
jgi:putative aminopeptidase